MVIQEYFQKPDAERILLVEITRNDPVSTKYFLSDSNYVTSPSDTIPNLVYSSVIGGTGLPGIRRTLNDPFSGNASTGFGSFTLVDSKVSYKDTITSGETDITLRKGAEVKAFLAAPISLFPRSDAVPLLSGRVTRTGGDSSGNITVEVTDGTEDIRNKTITIDSKPLAFGYVRNITPRLTNPALLEYYVHDGAIEAVTAVYDQGALLSPSQYTVDLATGKLTLFVSPVGTLTADVKGSKVSGVWLQSTEQITARLLSIAGISISQIYNGVPSGLIGLYLDQSELLGNILNRLYIGIAGYWLIDKNNSFYAAQYPIPSTIVESSYTEDEIIGEANFQDVDRLYSRINFTYRTNYTQYQSRPSATVEQATFSSKPNLQSFVQDPSPIDELMYQDSPELNTLFDSLSDAQSVANRVLQLYRQPRQIVSLTVPYVSTLDIGDNIFVSFFGKEFFGSVVSAVDIFDGSYPVQQIEIIA